jgi:hypothetical protein
MRLRSHVLVACAACVAGALAWLLVPRPAQRQWVLEAAWAEERSTDPRPTHVADPLPGTFGELLEPHLAALHDSFVAFKALSAGSRDELMRIYNGKASSNQLGPVALRDLQLRREAMRGVLRATHATFARPPTAFRLFYTWRPDAPFLDLQHASRLAAIDILMLLDQGRVHEAVEECVDVLALGRDVSYPSVLGRMIAVSMLGIVSHACGRALTTAPLHVVEGVPAQLAVIRTATPRFSDILARERLFGLLVWADADDRLPEGARTLMADAAAQHASVTERLKRVFFRATAQEGVATRSADYMAAQRLDWPACIARTDAIDRRFEWNPLLTTEFGFTPLLRRHRDGLVKLDALACAALVSIARARTGTMPQDLAATCPPIQPEAKCGEQSTTLRIALDGISPRVSVTLSDGSEFAVPLSAGKNSGPAALAAPP